MKNSKITITDIAESLGVSTISVSRALSGQTGVSEELRTKIIERARELGYSKTKNNEDINILVLHQKPYYQDNTNFSYMVQGIEKNLQKVGAEYSVEFVDKENQQTLYLPYKISKGHRFHGVIFIGRFEKQYVEFIKEKVKNFVFYTGYSPSYDYDSVWFNFNNNGYKQCEYLINKGHKLIGFVGNIHSFKNREKLLGITTAMEDYGIAVKEKLFFDVEDNLEEKVEELVACSEKPTAIICQWDFTAMKLMKLLYEKGYKIPQDISVIGSGNSEASSVAIPALTTLDLNIEYSCMVAVNLLIRRINDPLKPNENITISSKLIERDSVRNIL